MPAREQLLVEERALLGTAAAQDIAHIHSWEDQMSIFTSDESAIYHFYVTELKKG